MIMGGSYDSWLRVDSVVYDMSRVTYLHRESNYYTVRKCVRELHASMDPERTCV